MLWSLLLCSMMSAPPHGGQFQAPILPDDEGEVTEFEAGLTRAVAALPGAGPMLEFDATRWEWWFEYHQEQLLDLKQRMPARASSRPYAPVSDRDRLKTLLPLFVDSLRRDTSAIRKVGVHPNSRDVRAAAVMALGRLSLSDAVPYIELLVDDDPDLFVRTQAVLALGVSGQPNAVEALVRLFRDTDQSDEIRGYAVAGLALVANADAVEVIGQSLTEKGLAAVSSNQLRAAVIHAAGVSAHPRLAEPLRLLAASNVAKREADVRALIAMALGSIDDQRNINVLRKLLSDADNQVRRSTAAALSGISARFLDDDTAFAISRFTQVSDHPTRLHLARALGPTHSDAARETLNWALTDSNSLLRAHAGIGLALDGDGRHVEPLMRAFERAREPSLTGALAVSMGLLGADEAVPLLLADLEKRGDPAVQAYVLLALGLIDPVGVDELDARVDEAMRSSHDVEVQRWGVVALGLLGARDRLDELSADVGTTPSLIDRATRIFALGLVGDRAQLDDLVAIVEDSTQPAFVRTYALVALGELGDPRPIAPASRLSRYADLNLDIGYLLELYRTL